MHKWAMTISLAVRRTLKWTAVLFGTLLLVSAAMVAIAGTRLGRPLLIRCAELFVERPIKVGDLQVQLFSLNPRVVAENITVGNPPWTPPGVALQADRISLDLRLPGLRHPGGVTAVDIQGAGVAPHTRRNWTR